MPCPRTVQFCGTRLQSLKDVLKTTSFFSTLSPGRLHSLRDGSYRWAASCCHDPRLAHRIYSTILVKDNTRLSIVLHTWSKTAVIFHFQYSHLLQNWSPTCLPDPYHSSFSCTRQVPSHSPCHQKAYLRYMVWTSTSITLRTFHFLYSKPTCANRPIPVVTYKYLLS
jgi:hypothetical protein